MLERLEIGLYFFVYWVDICLWCVYYFSMIDRNIFFIKLFISNYDEWNNKILKSDLCLAVES